MEKKRLYSYILGKFQPNELKMYILITFMISTLLLCISWLFYPKDLNYSIMTHTISYLGVFTNNPNGWLFFSFSFIVGSVSFFPLILYLHRRVLQISDIGAWIGTVLLFIGSIGFILTALIPDEYGYDFLEDVSLGKAHNIVAILGVIGFSAGLFVYGFLFFIDYWPCFHKNRESFYAKLSVFPIFFPFTIIGIGLLITQIIAYRLKVEWPGPGILSFPLWEWMLTFAFFFTIYGLSLRLPSKIPETREIKEN